MSGSKKKLKNKIGSYNSSRLDLEKYKNKITEAINRAKLMLSDNNERWPVSTGTHVYKVVENIIGGFSHR